MTRVYTEAELVKLHGPHKFECIGMAPNEYRPNPDEYLVWSRAEFQFPGVIQICRKLSDEELAQPMKKVVIVTQEEREAKEKQRKEKFRAKPYSPRPKKRPEEEEEKPKIKPRPKKRPEEEEEKPKPKAKPRPEEEEEEEEEKPKPKPRPKEEEKPKPRPKPRPEEEEEEEEEKPKPKEEEKPKPRPKPRPEEEEQAVTGRAVASEWQSPLRVTRVAGSTPKYWFSIDHEDGEYDRIATFRKAFVDDLGVAGMTFQTNSDEDITVDHLPEDFFCMVSGFVSKEVKCEPVFMTRLVDLVARDFPFVRRLC